MKVAIVGATSGMGRALARIYAERGDQLWLLGRNTDELQRSATDLKERGASEVGTVHCDLIEPDGFADAIDATFEGLGGVDVFVITAADFDTQDNLEASPERARRLLTINLANTIALCETVRPRLLAAGKGTLCVFSSVAGDRGRKPVGIYGASKAGLSHYLESLDHKYRAEGLVTVCVKPGFVRTSMTEGLDAPPFAGEPDAVAASVARAIDRGTPLIYAPGIWRLVMLVIQHLPRFVMRKVGF